MSVVKIDKRIIRRARSNGLWKNLSEFIACCQADKAPPRIYKRSGIAADGTRFELHLRLELYHHHLHRRAILS